MQTLLLLPALVLLFFLIQMLVNAEKQTASFFLEGKDTSVQKPKTSKMGTILSLFSSNKRKQTRNTRNSR